MNYTGNDVVIYTHVHVHTVCTGPFLLEEGPGDKARHFQQFMTFKKVTSNCIADAIHMDARLE